MRTLSSCRQTFSSRCSTRRPCDRVSSIYSFSILSDSTSISDGRSLVKFLGNTSISSHAIWLKLDLVVRAFKNEVKLSLFYLATFFAGVREDYTYFIFGQNSLISDSYYTVLMAARKIKKSNLSWSLPLL